MAWAATNFTAAATEGRTSSASHRRAAVSGGRTALATWVSAGTSVVETQWATAWTTFARAARSFLTRSAMTGMSGWTAAAIWLNASASAERYWVTSCSTIGTKGWTAATSWPNQLATTSSPLRNGGR